jgi:MFS family permease
MAVLSSAALPFLWVHGDTLLFAGIAGDRFSKGALIAGSVAIWSTFTVLSGLSPNGAFLLVCRGLLGVSESMFMPAAYALIAAAHGPQTRSRAVGIFATSQLVGVALGGSLSGFVAERFNWRVSFWLLGGTGILFAWPLWRFLSRMPSFSKHRTGKAVRNLFRFAKKIPSLRAVTLFVPWLQRALPGYTGCRRSCDEFHLGLARAG